LNLFFKVKKKIGKILPTSMELVLVSLQKF
jgi:hypothetical protein